MVVLFWLVFSISVVAFVALIVAWKNEHKNGVAVLLYHRLRTLEDYERLTGTEQNFSIPANRFRAHLEWMIGAGYEFLNAEQLHEVITGKRALSDHTAMITFDDGCRSVDQLARPILESMQIPAIVFVTTDANAWVFKDEPRLTNENIQKLAEADFEIGSHGVSHHGFDQMNAGELETELLESRKTLETLTGREIKDIALPLNFYDWNTLLACRSAGYRLTFTADPGRVRLNDPPYRLRRLAVEGQTTVKDLARSLTPESILQRRIVTYLKRLPPRLLGEARWMPIRRWLFDSPLGPFLNFRYLRYLVAGAALAWLVSLAVLATHVI